MDKENLDLIYIGPYEGTFNKAFDEFVHVKSQNKPYNCLWTSPANKDGISEWQDWCQHEDFNQSPTNEQWHIIPNEDCRILYLDVNSPEIDKYTYYILDGTDVYDDWKYKDEFDDDILMTHLRQKLDYEAIAKDYDAVYVPYETIHDKKYEYELFEGWDVSSCAFFRPKYYVLSNEEYALYKKGQFIPQDISDKVETLGAEYKQSDEYKEYKRITDLEQQDCNNYIFRLTKEEADNFQSDKELGYALMVSIEEELLKNGANPNIRTVGGMVPLMRKDNTLNDVELLLQYGANPWAKDNNDKSVFDYVREYGNKEIIDRILNALKNDISIRQEQEKNKYLETLPPKGEITSIADALLYEDEDSLKQLIHNGHCINACDERGNTFLHDFLSQKYHADAYIKKHDNLEDIPEDFVIKYKHISRVIDLLKKNNAQIETIESQKIKAQYEEKQSHINKSPQNGFTFKALINKVFNKGPRL